MRRWIALLTTSVIAASCGSASFEVSFGGGTGSVEEAAAFLIEGELADQVGTTLVADCPPVDDPDVGTTFTCTATTETGEVIEFDGIVDREDHIDLNSTNLVVADAVPDWEALVEGSVEETVGVDVVIDCGDGFIVLDANDQMTCEVSDPTGANADAPILIDVDDLDQGTFRWEIDG